MLVRRLIALVALLLLGFVAASADQRHYLTAQGRPIVESDQERVYLLPDGRVMRETLTAPAGGAVLSGVTLSGVVVE